VPILDVWVVCKVFPFWKFARLGPFRERFPIIGLKNQINTHTLDPNPVTHCNILRILIHIPLCTLGLGWNANQS